MSTTHRPPPKPMDLELTIISAKHLKNVNWRNGILTPYVIFYLDSNHTHATRSDDSNNTKPVWNERFVLPLQPAPNQTLSLEVYHSNPNDTTKPVGSLRVSLDDVIRSDNDVIKSYDLTRPSGRAQGKIRLKMNVRENNYQIAPQVSYIYQNCPPNSYGRYPPFNSSPSPSVPPSPVSAPSQSSYNYRSCSDTYPGYYHGGYYAPPALRAFADRPGGYGGPSAPVPGPNQWSGGYGGPSAPGDYVKLPPPPPPPRTVDGYGGVGGGGAGLSAPVDYVKLPPPPPQMPRTPDGYGGVGGGGAGLIAPVDYVKLPPPPPQMPRTPDGYGSVGGGGAGPSAPVDYAQYDQKQKSGKLGLGVGGVIGGMSGLSIDEGSRYEEKDVESEVNAREMDDYTDYRRRVDY